MLRAIAILTVGLMTAGCSIDGRSLPGPFAVEDPREPHLNLRTKGRMSFGVRREF